MNIHKIRGNKRFKANSERTARIERELPAELNQPARTNAVKVVLEVRLFRDHEGQYWSDTSFTYDSWGGYLTVFSEVHLICRVTENLPTHASLNRVDGPGVLVKPLPNYIGMSDWALRMPMLFRQIARAIEGDTPMLIRSPGLVGMSAFLVARLRRIPYSTYVVGDIEEVLRQIQHFGPLKAFVRSFGKWMTRRQVRHSCTVAFVPNPNLLVKYPPHTKPVLFTEAGINHLYRNSWKKNNTSWRIVSVGSMEQMYKGFDDIIRAIHLLRLRGLPATLTIIGRGRCSSDLERLAQELGIADSVCIEGNAKNSSEVMKLLPAFDLFVMASRTEGFPRALLEAMAVGLPCIGSDIPGIQLLLSDSDRFHVGNYTELADKLSDVLNNPMRQIVMSSNNLLKSDHFSDESQSRIRTEFLESLKNCSGIRRTL